MQNSKYSTRSSSASSTVSTPQRSVNRLKFPPTSEYEYLGRLVTRERPVNRKSNSIQQNLVFPQNKHKYHHSMGSHRREVHEEMPSSSDEDGDVDDYDGISKPLGVIRITDRHLREIYRLPTPPPTVKRVYHRLPSPEPKIIERVYVRRPAPQIIENVIEVPPEKVRIINREKYLEKSKPITRSRLIHLKSNDHHHQREEEEEEEEEAEEDQQSFIPTQQYCDQNGFSTSGQQSQQKNYIPSDQYSQQTTIPLNTSQQQQQQQQQQPATTLVYPPQANLNTVGYIESTIPPEIMFKSQQTFQMPAQGNFNQQMMQPTSYSYQPQQIIPNSPYGYNQF